MRWRVRGCFVILLSKVLLGQDFMWHNRRTKTIVYMFGFCYLVLESSIYCTDSITVMAWLVRLTRCSQVTMKEECLYKRTVLAMNESGIKNQFLLHYRLCSCGKSFTLHHHNVHHFFPIRKSSSQEGNWHQKVNVEVDHDTKTWHKVWRWIW